MTLPCLSSLQSLFLCNNKEKNLFSWLNLLLQNSVAVGSLGKGKEGKQAKRPKTESYKQTETMARQSGGSKLPPLTLLFHGENPPASSLRHVVPVSSERFDAFPVLLLHAATATMQASQRHDSQSSLEIIDNNSCSHTHTHTKTTSATCLLCAGAGQRRFSPLCDVCFDCCQAVVLHLCC